MAKDTTHQRQWPVGTKQQMVFWQKSDLGQAVLHIVVFYGS